MDKSFYKKEAESLQGLFEKFKSTSAQNAAMSHRDMAAHKTPDSDRLSKDIIIISAVLFLLIISMVGFLTVWLVN